MAEHTAVLFLVEARRARLVSAPCRHL